MALNLELKYPRVFDGVFQDWHVPLHLSPIVTSIVFISMVWDFCGFLLRKLDCEGVQQHIMKRSRKL
jgi:hypothetical protein